MKIAVAGFQMLCTHLYGLSEMILITHEFFCFLFFCSQSVKSFKKANMELIRRSKTTVKMAVENTKYFPIMKIFHSHTLILCCTSFDLNLVFKILKKMPQYILLGKVNCYSKEKIQICMNTD